MPPYLKNPQFAKAPDKIADRRAAFDELNELVTEGGGWLTSTPGHAEIFLECLPASGLPNVLADRGHDLRKEPDGQRILVSAAIVRTKRFSFDIDRPSLARPR
jgi:hypothetical protein